MLNVCIKPELYQKNTAKNKVCTVQTVIHFTYTTGDVTHYFHFIRC